MTYGLVSNRFVTVLRRNIITAEGKPYGRKTNLSVNERLGGGDRKGDRGSAEQRFVP